MYLTDCPGQYGPEMSRQVMKWYAEVSCPDMKVQIFRIHDLFQLHRALWS